MANVRGRLLTVVTLLLGLAVGSSLVDIVSAAAPQTCHCNASTLPAGPVTVRADLVCNGVKLETASTTITAPVDDVALAFADVPDGKTCSVKMTDLSIGGSVFYGRTIADFPGETLPSPTPSPAPSPSQTPSPSPTSSPLPIGTAALPPGCTGVLSAKDAIGNQFSIIGQDTNGGHVWLVTPDGKADYSFPGGGWNIGSAAHHFVVANGVVYGREIAPEFRKGPDGAVIPGAGQYFKLTGRNQAVLETPVCIGGATPTPTISPTPTGSPQPATVAATIESKSCSINISAPKPAAAIGAGWKVQYFDGTVALSTSSTTVKRAVVIQAGVRSALRAVWSRSGSAAITQPLAPVTCSSK